MFSSSPFLRTKWGREEGKKKQQQPRINKAFDPFKSHLQ
jgi:hypothetical protein